jgi:hypothetical protein
MNYSRIAIIAIFVLAALVRLPGVFRPLDKASWRECDLGAVSRNFVREGMDLFHPRIDWRGDGPGYAEMEFPIYPFLTAITYKELGFHDQLARVWAFLFSLGTLLFFYRLVREFLDDIPAIAATAFFYFNPLTVELSTSVQPEGLMIMAYVAATYFFVRWIKTDELSAFAGAAAMTALALLAKASAAHIGLFFGLVLLQKYGVAAVKQARIWLFGLISVVPGALWYVYAKGLWKTYGNSLGVSNEYHWIGPDFFTNPYFVKGILANESTYVWVTFGVFIAAYGLWKGFRDELARYCVLWLISVFIFYAVASRTTADEWAYYYHIFSVPAFALLFGLGVRELIAMVRETIASYSQISVSSKLVRGTVPAAALVAVLLTFALEAKQVRANYQEVRSGNPEQAFAQTIKPQMVKPGLILASGGHCTDPDGYQVAYNASYMFYWLDRKGWNVCVEQQSVDAVREFAARGAVYFVAERKYLRAAPELEDDLRRAYTAVAANTDIIVFDLTATR